MSRQKQQHCSGVLLITVHALQAETFTPEDAQTLSLPDDAEKAKLQDPLSRLENAERDKSVARE